jgi:hypothetical protein
MSIPVYRQEAVSKATPTQSACKSDPGGAVSNGLGHPLSSNQPKCDQNCAKWGQESHVQVQAVLKYGEIMLTCIPSARDACEHDDSIFQQNVPSLVDASWTCETGEQCRNLHLVNVFFKRVLLACTLTDLCYRGNMGRKAHGNGHAQAEAIISSDIGPNDAADAAPMTVFQAWVAESGDERHILDEILQLCTQFLHHNDGLS